MPFIPDPESLDKMRERVVPIAVEAGDIIRSIYTESFNVEYKADNSPLTQADIAANAHITKALTAEFPDIPIISEEALLPDFAERSSWQTFWLVDPLDGTKEFVKRTGEFTVNIALVHNNRPILGVIYTPEKKWLHYATKDNGAFSVKDNNTTKLTVRNRVDPKHLLVAGSKSHGTEKLAAFLQGFENHSLASMGSSLKICMVAEGAVDIYPRFGPTSAWDTAAGHAIVLESGGQIVDLNLEPLEYNRKESILNPEFLVIGDIHYPWEQHLERTQDPHADDRSDIDFG